MHGMVVFITTEFKDKNNLFIYLEVGGFSIASLTVQHVTILLPFPTVGVALFQNILGSGQTSEYNLHHMKV